MKQMSDERSSEEMLEERLLQLQEEENHKRMLHDRTIGGENVPRPSIQFIQDCVGTLKSDAELRAEAQRDVERMGQQMIDEAMQRKMVEQSMREHAARVAEMQSLKGAIDRVEDSPILRDAFEKVDQNERDDLYERLADHEHAQRQNIRELSAEEQQNQENVEDHGPEE